MPAPSPSPSSIASRARILLADDHNLVRAGIKALLSTLSTAEVVGEAADGEELLALARQLRPDIVVTDIAMPRLDGISAIPGLHRIDPRLKVIVLSMHDGHEYVHRAVRQGACGFVRKDCAPWELHHAIATVMASGRYFDAHAGRRLLQRPEPAPDEVLTPRQLQVLTLIAHGLGSRQIGAELGLSPKTVDVHRGRLMERLQLRDIASLTRYALRKGLLKAPR